MVKKKPLIITLILLMFLTTVIGSHTLNATTTPTIYIDPPSTITSIDAAFSVNISVSQVTDLCSWQAYIYFKKDILEATGYAEGPFLKSYGPTMFDGSFNNDYNETHGELWMYCLRTWSGTGVNGSGTLGTATFKAKTAGSTSLTLANTILGNSSAQRIYHTTADGQVEVGRHDVAIENVTHSKTIICQGYSSHINVTAKNKGYYTETFNITVYANDTAIQTQTVTLANGSSTTIIFIWNTTGFAKGNHTISAYAYPVPYETNVTDNTFIGGVLTLVYPGDVHTDGKVDMKDIAAIAKAFGSKPGDSLYDPNYDIDNNRKIDMKDIAIAAKNFGYIDP